jgi:hypothetical protein
MPRSFTTQSLKAVKDAAEVTVFGRTITDDEYGDLIGDITGNATGVLTFNVFSLNVGKDVAIQIRSTGPVFNTTVRLNPNEFHYSDIRVHNTGQGIGKDIFRLLVATVPQFHFPRLDATGERRDDPDPTKAECGYYAYPKFGFEGDIPANVKPNLNPPYNAMVKLSEIMATPAGEAEWRLKGITVKNIVFDLTPGQYSMNKLNSLP